MDVNSILTSVDLVDLARQAGSRMTQNGGEWRGNCPLHGGDNPTAFVIYYRNGKQHWHCFTRSECGGGDAIDFVMRWHGLDFVEACRYLGGTSDIDANIVSQAAIERAQRAEEALKEQIEIAQRALEDLRAAQIWLKYHENLNDESRQLWKERGIPEDYQNWWMLGYNPSYTIKTPQGKWITPTLTIPIYAPGWDVVNVRHRLLNPYRQGDKYRPERVGLKAEAFISDPDTGYDADRILVVEGEIKAMVAFITADTPGFQVVGIPGKNSFSGVADKLIGHSVWLCFDPDATKEAMEAALKVGGRVVQLPMKIDDAILAGALDKTGLKRLIENAKRIRL